MMSRKAFKRVAFATLAMAFVGNVYAVAPGFYMGVMLGPATNSGGNVQVLTLNPPPNTTTAKPKSTQFGSRYLMGYKMNQYAGFEFGLNYFTGIQYDTNNVQTCSSTQVRVRSIDLTAKGSVPLQHFELFGKIGPALTYQTTSGDMNINPTRTCKSKYITKVSPTVSVGVGYDLSQSWVIDASANRLMTGGKAGNIDFYALGLTYHFVDRYCGQFLCED